MKDKTQPDCTYKPTLWLHRPASSSTAEKIHLSPQNHLLPRSLLRDPRCLAASLIDASPSNVFTRAYWRAFQARGTSKQALYLIPAHSKKGKGCRKEILLKLRIWSNRVIMKSPLAKMADLRNAEDREKAVSIPRSAVDLMIELKWVHWVSDNMIILVIKGGGRVEKSYRSKSRKRFW